MHPLRRLFAALLLCLALPAVAEAHKIKVFATAEGATISGYVYYPGGGRYADGPVALYTTPDANPVATTTTDAQGAFSFTATQRCDYLLVVETGDGHRAQFTVPAADLPQALPACAADEAAVPPPPSQPAVAPTAAPAAVAAPTELTAAIERIVAHQIRPLREQLEAYEERVRLHDILGGIGYILGLAGLAILLTYRRRDRGKND